jgi:cyclopropane-fatty-acyl-phospholipid synthase
MDKLVEIFLSRVIHKGSLEVTTSKGQSMCGGDGTGPQVAVRFKTRAAELRLLVDPELALGELYMDGAIVLERGSIYDLLELGLRNLGASSNARWMQLLQESRVWMRRFAQNNHALRSVRNVVHHYDLDSNLYALFLDSDRQYSCAYFESPDDTLEDAQLAKKRHIAAKLVVDPGQRVLDIGCGWGGMGLYLAEICNANVTGVTLSREQLAVARGRAVERGLGRRVDFRFQDYRAIDETFDRIVSVGMFEHVGVGFFDIYFKKIADLLTDDGIALVHTIGRTDRPGATNPWIAKYIFPGGYIPAMSEVLPAIERAGLIVTDVEVLQLHYAETLKAWRDRFVARWEQVANLYDDRFCRMWEFYLAGSEAAFRLGQMVNFQFQLARNVNTVPMTRSYIAEREEALRARERSGASALRPVAE